ncbi:MAG: sugar ABC transporter permease [Caldilinea sp. CFX5]|nr:sugar ABC transporter permease [Caldilinea sp. CFX5]
MNSTTTLSNAKGAIKEKQGRKLSWSARVWREVKRNHFAYTIMLPLLIHFLLFEFGPFVFSFVLTFMNWKLVGTPQFVGLANWRDSFQDPLVWQALRNTTLFALYYVVPTIVLAFFMALIINTGVRGAKVFKTLVLMPFVTSGVIIAGIWQHIFKGSDSGLFNVLLGWFSIPPQIYFSDPQLAMLVLAALSVFRVSGYLMIYYLAGLQSIPTYLYEAADIDGATAWKKTWYITIPLLKPIHFFVAIITTISAFQVFEQMFVITKGGPAFGTTTIVYYLYQMGFNMLRLGYATVVAFILFVVIFVLSLIQRWYLGKEVSYY